jgi:hypothetical protein
MRWAKSYSIIDHQLLHGGYLERMSHESMNLYLFLVLVGDRNGKSYYSETRIMQLLRLDDRQIEKARQELIQEGLIAYESPYWRVKTIRRE